MLVEDEKNVRFAEGEENVENNNSKTKSRRWLFGGGRRQRRSSKHNSPEAAEEPNVSILSDQYQKFSKTNSDTTEIQTRTMVVHPRAKTKKEFRPKKELILPEPPSAREAAFGGPVRYDWIDIETSAAVKVQAAYRRNKVMNDLERAGYSTGAIRNRARRRNAESAPPSLFNCFGANCSFADFTADDREAHKEYQRLVYQEQKKARFHHEEELRLGYSQKHRMRRSQRNQVDEAFEVVE